MENIKPRRKMSLEKSTPKDYFKVYTMDDCYSEMLVDFHKGLEKGTTTYSKELDKAWTWRRGEVTLSTGYANEGKALDIETIIPIQGGFKTMKDIEVGDKVFDENGKVCNVTNVTDIMYDRECYEIIFSGSIKVIADSDHQWVVYSTANTRKPIILTTKNIAGILDGDEAIFVKLPPLVGNIALRITSIKLTKSVPVKCIEVDSPNHMYLCTEHHIPTHNSLFTKQMCMIKYLSEGKKFIFCSPEDFPPKSFFDDMIHTLSGKSTDRGRIDCISEEEYEACYNRLKEGFYFLHIKPPHNTVTKVLELSKVLIDSDPDIMGLIIDPIMKFSREKEAPERDDLFAGYTSMNLTEFTRENNICTIVVMHQLTPRKNSKDLYDKPSMYNIKSGGSWADGADNVFYVWRPFYAKDKLDPTVAVGTLKIKKQKLVGIPQDVEMSFNRKSNRYLSSLNKNFFDFDKHK